MKTNELTKIGAIAAVYAVITIILSPIAYGPLQFRLSEIMKPLALKGRTYIYGLTLGLFIANLFSPFPGPWEIIFMPLVALSGGFITHYLKSKPYLAVTFYSLWIAGGVAVTLNMMLGLPMLAIFPGVFISELILMTAGVRLIESIFRRSRQT